MRRPRRLRALLAVLLLHGFGALMWVGWLGFSSDAGTDRQLYEALGVGAATWLVAALLIAWLWRSGRATVWIPFAWWLPSFLLMIAVVYGWNSPVEGYRSAVYAKATFEESAECLRYWRDWRLDDVPPLSNVGECFPTQSAAKKRALIACFNDYERDHPGHDGWPEANMRGCTWDGLVAVPVRNVASLRFGKVVARPAAPRAGQPLLISVALTRRDSAAKVKIGGVETPALNVSVTVDGEPVEVGSVEGCSECRLSGDPEAEHWFEEGEIQVKFTVPKTAEGKRLAIKMTAAHLDTPTATKVVTFTVGP